MISVHTRFVKYANNLYTPKTLGRKLTPTHYFGIMQVSAKIKHKQTHLRKEVKQAKYGHSNLRRANDPKSFEFSIRSGQNAVGHGYGLK